MSMNIIVVVVVVVVVVANTFSSCFPSLPFCNSQSSSALLRKHRKKIRQRFYWVGSQHCCSLQCICRTTCHFLRPSKNCKNPPSTIYPKTRFFGFPVFHCASRVV